MNVLSWAVWGFAATVFLTTVLACSQGLHLTRLNIPFLLGTFITPDRDKAKWLGVFIHLINGFIFSLIYVLAFHAWGAPSWSRGAVIGLVHSLFVLAVAFPNMPGVHPRMSSEYIVFDEARSLEPPGFMAINYGFSTPVSVVIAHIVFGAILGAFYQM